MSRSKETLVFVIDVSPSLHSNLKHVSKAASSVIEKKLFKQSGDDIGLVLFGMEETDNPLRRAVHIGYESVVYEPIRQIDESFVKKLRLLPRGRYPGDFVDAVVVAADIFKTWLGPGKRGNKRICLITDAQSPVKEPETGSKMEQVELIGSKMAEIGLKFDAVVLKMNGESALESVESAENHEFLQTLCEQTHGELVHVESPLHLLAVLNPRTTSSTTLFRGDMELTPGARVKVWVYKKAAQERVPSLKHYSEKAPQNDESATHEVKMDIEYKYADDPTVSVTKAQRAKGYYYGQQLIPVTPDMELSLKFTAEKGVKVLGFTESTNIPRHYYMKEPNIFIPEPGNEKAIRAISALARALKKADMVAVVRCAWRQGQKSVVIGLLTPNLASEPHMTDSFYFNVIPFAEDIREFGFPSFEDRPASMLPSQAQKDAAISLVEMLDLSPPNASEELQPEKTINPVLQRFYHYLYLKLGNADTPIPPLDDTLKKIVDPMYSAEQEQTVTRFCENFTLADVQKSKKKAIEDGEDGDVPSLEAPQIEKVGSLNPIEDFEALLSRRDSDEWVGKAIQGMKVIINDLITSAETYDKAVSCIAALRKGCVVYEEPGEYNKFYCDLVQQCREKQLNDLWQKAVNNRIGLITKEEAPDSEVVDGSAFDLKPSVKKEENH